MNKLSETQWTQFQQDGYIKLGNIMSAGELEQLQQRINDIMLGKADVPYDQMLMQLDSDTGNYSDAPEQSKGFKQAALDYRKIQDLELDPVFLSFLQRPVFKDICQRAYGKNANVGIFRAMFMNKPANKGTFLPWHQDRWTSLNKDPLITVWTALDPATKENGCVQIIPGSHRNGLINPDHPSGFLSKKQTEERIKEKDIVYLELEAGEVALLHNYVLHGSDKNNSKQSRRAFSTCYMDAATLENGKPNTFPVAFGKGALSPETGMAVIT